MERYNDMLRISAARIFFIVPSLYRFDRCSFSIEDSKNLFNAFSPVLVAEAPAQNRKSGAHA